jgi:hypothetical protein
VLLSGLACQPPGQPPAGRDNVVHDALVIEVNQPEPRLPANGGMREMVSMSVPPSRTSMRQLPSRAIVWPLLPMMPAARESAPDGSPRQRQLALEKVDAAQQRGNGCSGIAATGLDRSVDREFDFGQCFAIRRQVRLCLILFQFA